MAEGVQQLKDKVLELTESYNGMKELVSKVKEIRSFGDILSSIGLISEFVTNLILTVELAFNEVEGLKKEEKLTAAADLLDEYFKFPWYLEVIDRQVFEILLSYGVSMLNRQYGKDWNLDKARETLETGKDFIDKIA